MYCLAKIKILRIPEDLVSLLQLMCFFNLLLRIFLVDIDQ